MASPMHPVRSKDTLASIAIACLIIVGRYRIGGRNHSLVEVAKGCTEQHYAQTLDGQSGALNSVGSLSACR